MFTWLKRWRGRGVRSTLLLADPHPRTIQMADHILNHYHRDSMADKICLARRLEKWAREFAANIPNQERAAMKNDCSTCKHGVNVCAAGDDAIWRMLDDGRQHPCQSCILNRPYPDNWEPVKPLKPDEKDRAR